VQLFLLFSPEGSLADSKTDFNELRRLAMFDKMKEKIAEKRKVLPPIDFSI
jgi:hypothetical protein